MRSFWKTKRRPRHAQCKTHRANRAGSNGTGGARSWHTLIVGAFLLATGMIAPTAQADTPEGQVTWGIAPPYRRVEATPWGAETS